VFNGLLPFNYGTLELLIYKIKNYPYLFVQASNPKLNLESFKSIVNSTLYLFCYLTGLSTLGDFCVVELGEAGTPKETFIYGGLTKKSTNLTPVVANWSEFNRARKELGLPNKELKDRRPFNPENISE